jgi:Chitin synthase
VYSFFLPIYSFWCMDDFSWGNTRVVIGDGGSKKLVMNEDERFDESMTPLKKFSGESSAWAGIRLTAQVLRLYIQSMKQKHGKVHRDTRTRLGSARRVLSHGSHRPVTARHIRRMEGATGIRTW